MIDVHCHLNFKAFEKDVEPAIERAEKAGVNAIINVGAQISSSRKAVELAEKYENLYATVGIHPHHADKLENDWEKHFEKLAKHPKVVAVGECGMDFYSYGTSGIASPKLQEQIFSEQIELASRANLPLQVHNRLAGDKILNVLLNHQSSLLNPPGVFHCFSGSREFLKKVLDLGFYIGFDGNITYKGTAPNETTDLKELVRLTPLERILIETDSPYLAPIPYRGSRNEPSYAIIIAEFVAQLKQLSIESIKAVTTQNAKYLFRLNSV